MFKNQRKNQQNGGWKTVTSRKVKYTNTDVNAMNDITDGQYSLTSLFKNRICYSNIMYYCKNVKCKYQHIKIEPIARWVSSLKNIPKIKTIEKEMKYHIIDNMEEIGFGTGKVFHPIIRTCMFCMMGKQCKNDTFKYPIKYGNKTIKVDICFNPNTKSIRPTFGIHYDLLITKKGTYYSVDDFSSTEFKLNQPIKHHMGPKIGSKIGSKINQQNQIKISKNKFDLNSSSEFPKLSKLELITYKNNEVYENIRKKYSTPLKEHLMNEPSNQIKYSVPEPKPFISSNNQPNIQPKTWVKGHRMNTNNVKQYYQRIQEPFEKQLDVKITMFNTDTEKLWGDYSDEES